MDDLPKLKAVCRFRSIYVVEALHETISLMAKGEATIKIMPTAMTKGMAMAMAMGLRQREIGLLSS